jgi:nucleoside-diphosphate-sugar epimerase
MLVERGYTVRATIRSSSNTRWLDPLPVEQTVVDLTDPSGLASALDDIGAVVHVGGITTASDPEDFERVNAEGTGRLAAAAGAAGVERMVYISSLAARGPDGSGGPDGEYGLSKLAGEQRIAELAAAGAAPPIIRVLRPGGIYGPRDSDLLAMFRMAKRGLIVIPSTEARLQPVHVRDVSSATLRALETDSPVDPGPLPIMGPETLGWAEVAEALRSGYDRPARVLRLPPAAFMALGVSAEFGARITGKSPVFDRRRAAYLTTVTFTSEIESTKLALDWEPEMDLSTGMVDTLAWYAANGWV